MDQDIHSIEEALLSSRDEFVSRQHKQVDHAIEQFGKHNVSESKIDRPAMNASEQRPKRSSNAGSYKTGYMIKLAVRKKHLAMDELFEYESSKISKLEAQIDAEKAAKASGYPIIGYVHSIEKR